MKPTPDSAADVESVPAAPPDGLQQAGPLPGVNTRAAGDFRLADGNRSLHRRNSQLVVETVAGCPRLVKTYHHEYTAADEFAAYQKLAPLCAGIAGIRLPEIVGIDTAANTIRIEFIRGRDLRRAIRSGGFGVLDDHASSLLQLLVQSRRENLPFDADPANLIIMDGSLELVLVDPVCRRIDLPDFSAVVFLFGLFKASLSHPFRLRVLGYPGVFHNWCRQYCHRSGGSEVEIRDQLARYVAQVLSWNLEPAGESWGLRMGRRALWVPVLRLFRRWLLSGGRQQHERS